MIFILKEEYGDGHTEDWRSTYKINLNIIPLKENEYIYMKDIVSKKDVVYIFTLIDSLLEYLDVGVIEFSRFSL